MVHKKIAVAASADANRRPHQSGIITMNRILVLILLAASGCANLPPDKLNATQEDYQNVIGRYCKMKYPNNGYNECLMHMKNGYLTNEEINYINERTKWWREREGS